jgi:hypothetical protein
VRTGREFNRFLGSATVVNEKGYDVLLAELKKLEKEALEREPELKAIGYEASDNS